MLPFVLPLRGEMVGPAHEEQPAHRIGSALEHQNALTFSGAIEYCPVFVIRHMGGVCRQKKRR